uniref:Secondary thiamine-phosphate synthase enzyme n=1 Tax=Minutocellus polymorphus TaxID=265543 RepID=A0A7S0ACC9_9STRA|mmetsp:Transcript_10542/g.17469  ORF Transcript_10542/g.17469 Transcript_10542/m.17469 type:complete len:230 (+) Transcript_10542:40-729(+)
MLVMYLRPAAARLLPLLLFAPIVAGAFLPPSSFYSIPLVEASDSGSSGSCLPPSSPDSGSSSSSRLSSSSNPTDSTMAAPQWFQKEISITAPSRGCHLITSDINKAIKDDLSKIKIGLANLFIMHTSASLTVNENADPDVRRDMEVALNKIVPAEWNRDGTFRHTMEGDDDMPGHMKSSLMGASLTIPIRNGRLALGTWQGVYLNEHRNQGGWGGGHTRHIVITLQGTS